MRHFPLWAALFFLCACSSPQPQAEVMTEPTENANASDSTENTRFGIPIDTLTERNGTISSGQTMAEVLYKEGFDDPLIAQWLAPTQHDFDVSNIRAGQPYTVFCTRGPKGKPVCLVYEQSKTKYVVFDGRNGKPEIYQHEKPVTLDTLTAAGIIENSLYQTVVDLGYDQALCMEMAEVLRWSVDFFALQPGDKFRALYTANMLEGTPLGVEDILALEFTHHGKTIFAYRFTRADQTGYYDAEGKSLKSRFLQAPLEFSRISSRFTMNRYHPILKRNKPHLGTDYAAPHGTPIVTVADGVVEEAAYRGGNGNFVKVRHDHVYTTQYLHMSKFGPGIRRGVRVQQGQVIGYVGSTGLATGPHLCYRFWKNGKQVDPFRETPQSTEPLAPADMPAFLAQKEALEPALQTIRYHEAALFASVKTLRDMVKY